MKVNILGLSESSCKETGEKTSGKCYLIYSGETKEDMGFGIILDKTTRNSVKGCWPLSGQILLVKIAEKPLDNYMKFKSMQQRQPAVKKIQNLSLL